MKFLKRHKRSDVPESLPDVVELVSLAIAAHEAKRMVALPVEDGAQTPAELLRPTDEHRARAQSLLYDFSMRHFSSQIETLRQGAILDYVANTGRDRMRFMRLFSIGMFGALTAIVLAGAAWIAATRYGINDERIVNALMELVLLVRTRFGI